MTATATTATTDQRRRRIEACRLGTTVGDALGLLCEATMAALRSASPPPSMAGRTVSKAMLRKLAPYPVVLAHRFRGLLP